MAVSLIALLGTIATLVVGYMKERDKLRFDMRLKELEWKQELCEKENKKLNEKIVQLEIRDNQDKQMLSDKIENVKKLAIDKS